MNALNSFIDISTEQFGEYVKSIDKDSVIKPQS